MFPCCPCPTAHPTQNHVYMCIHVYAMYVYMCVCIYIYVYHTYKEREREREREREGGLPTYGYQEKGLMRQSHQVSCLILSLRTFLWSVLLLVMTIYAGCPVSLAVVASSCSALVYSTPFRRRSRRMADQST